MRYREPYLQDIMQYNKTYIAFSKVDVYRTALRHLSRTWLLLLGILPYRISLDNFEDT